MASTLWGTSNKIQNKKFSNSSHFGLTEIKLNTCKSVWLGSIPHFHIYMQSLPESFHSSLSSLITFHA